MAVTAADERPHAAGPSPAWMESWHLDVATPDGVGLAVRLACAPAAGVAWWWTHLVLPDVAGPVVVRDHEVGLPRQGLEVRADGLWGELFCETPFEHWTYGLEAFGVRLDDPADSLRGEIGERMPVGLDIEWEFDPAASGPHELADDGVVTGYEQFGGAHGEVLLGRSRFELEGPARRSHTWRPIRLDRTARSVWMCSPELAVSFTARDGDAVDGYVAATGAAAEPISTVRSETHRRADGLPVAARHVVDERIEIDVDVLALVAVPLTVPVSGPDRAEAVLTRAPCRFGVDGTELRGWSSWLDPGTA
jgi:hypothetical protein